jgi:type IV pilus assembly protein PilA
MPTDNTVAGLAAANAIQGKYVSLVTVANGIITVTYGNSAHTTIAGQTIQLAPDVTDVGSVQWVCTSAAAAIANKHLPAACRT